MAFKDAKTFDTRCVVEVARTARVTPTMMRVTVAGEQLGALEHRGFDHWFRLFLPRDGETNFDLPARMDLRGYIGYLRMPKETRPPMRNYTVREFRPDARELDIDFVAHGDAGPASRFALSAQVGDRLALVDQGCGWDPVPVDWTLLVADETGLPAVLGILRDMPRTAVGHASIEVPHADDAQPADAPAGMSLSWVVRSAADRPGARVVEAVQSAALPSGTPYAYLVGEQSIPTTLRRWLVGRGVPKSNITFTGYWRLGKR